MRIGIMGAGAIGSYIGGRMIASGSDVALVGRASIASDIIAHGLKITDYRGYNSHVSTAKINFTTTPEILTSCDVVFITVKSFATNATAKILKALLNKDCLVVSLQNGVRNVRELRAGLPEHKVLGGIVPFNVVSPQAASFHCASSGQLIVEACDLPAATVTWTALQHAGLEVEVRKEVASRQWGKLLVNLGNGINALAGIPLKAQLDQRAFRLLIAATIREAATIVKSAGISVALPFPIPTRWVANFLSLPDSIFLPLIGLVKKVDEHARSSMLEDLQRLRPTEIDYLNGEIVALAHSQNLKAPINEAIVKLVKQAEQKSQGSPGLDAKEMARYLTV